MYLPKSGLDDSAKFELRLAETLRARNPTFDRSRVDLTPFKVRAKIDLITIRNPPHGITFAEITEMRGVMSGGLERPNDTPNQVTIHDPTRADLRYLFNNKSSYQVSAIEIAVDFHLPVGTNELYLLRQLKEQLRHCLAPQTHRWFKDTERKYANLVPRRYLLDAVSNAAPLTTVKYLTRTNVQHLKLYIKTRDNKQPVSHPFVRVELGLRGTDWAKLDLVKDLPVFARNLRKYCTPAFMIGMGFKARSAGDVLWARHGSAWDLTGSKGLRVQPDAAVNKKVGDALSDLGRSITAALKP
jgi:hypothetical protein